MKTERTPADYAEDLMRELGVGPALLGFEYLVCAVGLVVEDGGYLGRMTKGLYPDVARRFGTTAARAERAMRHAIARTFERGGREELEGLFGNCISAERGTVTCSEFTAGCAREVRRRMRNEG